MNPEQPGVPGRHDVQPGVDLDLLADYASGALDGTPDQARAARLIDTDAAWANTLDALRTADAQVGTALARLAGTPEPMPPDIATRLERVLAQAAMPDRQPNQDHRELGVPEHQAVPEQPVDLEAARNRRRRYRIAAVAAVAAGVLTLAAPAGYLLLGPGLAGSEMADRSVPESGAEAPGAATAGEQDRLATGGPGRGYPLPVAASGTDYTRDTVAAVRERNGKTAVDAASQVPSELSRLAVLPALEDCLTAIQSAHPGTVTIVDYARFEGAPALVVAITEPTGGNRVVVAGPDCGRSGADERYTTTA